MTEIERLHNLNQEIEDLENKYRTAIKLLTKTRYEMASILNGVKLNNIDTVKEFFILPHKKHWDEFMEKMKSYEEAEKYVEVVTEKTLLGI